MQTVGAYRPSPTRRRCPGCPSGRTRRSSHRRRFRLSALAFAHGQVCSGGFATSALRPIIAKSIDGAMLEPLNRICKRVGAKPLATSTDLMRRAPLILVASAQPFEYPHPDWDDRVQMIGPCEFEPPGTGVPDWIEAVDRPIVLVTTSSERQADDALPRAAMAAMRDRPVSHRPRSTNRSLFCSPMWSGRWTSHRRWPERLRKRRATC